MPVRRPRQAFRGCIVSCLILALATGCSSGPATIGPKGVDGLVIPTPSPDPADFVATITNPWLPLAPGSTWTYAIAGSDGVRIDTVRVLDQPKVVAGVTTTVVHDVVTSTDGRVVEDAYDWFAQDTAGNVWHFGEDTTSYDHGTASRQGSWQAGVDGAEAGVTMLASPRLGDGYRQELSEGVAEGRARVLSLAAKVVGPVGSWDDALQTEESTPLGSGVVERKYYVKGIGLVRGEEITGGDEIVVLRRYTVA